MNRCVCTYRVEELSNPHTKHSTVFLNEETGVPKIPASSAPSTIEVLVRHLCKSKEGARTDVLSHSTIRL